mmetsp:Transcript_17498/g.22993  ORF Transcript_17498/g.22993 Transcript_17498/m.22993 type:complete len:210 (-) Transcript_17498:905-1534(-)
MTVMAPFGLQCKPQRLARTSGCHASAVVLLISLMMATTTTLAFSPAMTKRCHHPYPYMHRNRACSSSAADNTWRLYMSGPASEQELKEMETLIINLSLEPTDESRRERLASLFAEELAKPNGFPKQFTDAFGTALETVGTQVQAIAAEKAMEKEKNKKQNDDEEDSSEQGKIGTAPEDRQLWALVDMMVQSKTLVKKASGELGSKGSFS